MQYHHLSHKPKQNAWEKNTQWIALTLSCCVTVYIMGLSHLWNRLPCKKFGQWTYAHETFWRQDVMSTVISNNCIKMLLSNIRRKAKAIMFWGPKFRSLRLPWKTTYSSSSSSGSSSWKWRKKIGEKKCGNPRCLSEKSEILCAYQQVRLMFAAKWSGPLH